MPTTPNTDERDAIPRACRGIAHELSNVLTYLLPTIQEVCAGQADLQAALGGPPAASRPPLEWQLDPDDIGRITRQLQQGGQRLSQLFGDLRRGFVQPSPERLCPVDLRAAIHEAMEVGPRPHDLRLRDEAPGVGLRVRADPALLDEALGRLLRAAAGWARVAELQGPVLVTLSLVSPVAGGPARARIEALLPGEPGRLPPPESLLDMLCPAETGAVRAERGALGILVGVHLFRVHGGDLGAATCPRGVGLHGELPLIE